MRADHDDLWTIPWDFRLDVVTRLPLHFVAVSSGPQSGSRKRIFDEIGSGVELGVMPHVALADFSRELLHIRTELLAHRQLTRQKRPRLRNRLPGHPHSKPPQ